MARRSQHEQPITVGTLIDIARRQYRLLLACWVAVVLLTVFFTLGQSKVYRAESLVRLDPEPPRPLGQKVELVSNNSSYWQRKEFYETEYRILKSMRAAMAVVRTLGLHADAGFLHAPSKHFAPIAIEDAARVLIARLSLEPVKDSRLVVVRYEDSDPKRSELILRTLVHTYLDQNLEATSAVSTNALEWLNGQLETLNVDLQKSELAVNDFRQKNNVLSISLEDRHNIISTQLESMSKDLTALQAKRDEASARYAQLAKVDAKDPQQAGTAELLGSVVLSSLRTDYNQHKSKLAELLATADEANPRVLSARGKLNDIATAIAKEIDNVRAAAFADLKKLDAQIGDLKKRDETIQQQAHELQTLAITYNQLSRTRTNKERIYQIVLERAQETSLMRMMNFNNVRVVDEPLVPRAPILPNVPMNICIGAFAGLLLGCAAALARHTADRSLKTPDDVSEHFGVPCLGMIPEIDGIEPRGTRQSRGKKTDGRDLYVAQHPESGVAEAVRVIRTNLTFSSPDKPYRSLVITSAIPEEGKTTVACSLAIAFAQGGLRVLLVDTDLRRPRIHRSFHISNDVGVSMVVTGQATLEESIRKSEVPGLDILPAGPAPPNPAELLQSERFLALAADLLKRYDRVVFDSPPLLPVTDAAILAQHFDGVIVVARAFETHRGAVRDALRTLVDLRSRIIGVILNAVDTERSEYQGSYYYRRHDYYRRAPEADARET